MDKAVVLQTFLDQLRRLGPSAVRNYQDARPWTVDATRALVQTGSALVPNGTPVAKGSPDRWGRKEYLTLDLVVLQDESWGPPALVAEHENHCHANRVRYNAWKLVSIDSPVRILVAYYGQWKSVATLGDLVTVVSEVTGANSRKELILIAGDWLATPKTMNDLLKCFSVVMFRGKSTES